MKKLTLLFALFAFNLTSISQINMGNLGTISNGCGQTFYDSGGSGGDYGSSQNYTTTFCAPAGQYITFNFTQFALGSGDNLAIYNGPNTGSPLLGNYPTTSPGQISSNLGGCLTFVFTSNAPTLGIFPSNGAGWTAAISCATTVPPPPPPPPGSCAAAQPFCTSTGVNYPAAVGTTSEVGPNYGCLSTQPSPAWFYLNIATAGNIMINLSNSAVHDIDFAIWGPFATQAAMCAGTTATPLDCSYSTAATEQVDIPNAQVGQWYIMVITNYANTPTNITAVAGDATGTDGTTNCNILCNMTALTATPGACVSPANTYSVTGSISVQYPPTSGTLTVSSSCGGSVTVPTPWTSPISYTLPGLTANGAACNLTAVFSADPTCTLTMPYTAPAACSSTCSITSLSATPGSCLAGNTYNVTGSIAFTGQPTTGTLTVTSSCGGTQTFNAPFTSPLAYNLTGLTANGAACTVTASFSATACSLTQNFTAPAIPVTNAGVDQTVCTGSTVTLAGAGASTYSWSPVITNGVAFTPAATTTYTLTGTNAAGCTATDQVLVTVNSVATANANVDQAVCAGGTVTLAGTVGGSATTGTWSAGSGTFSNASNLTSTFTPSITSGTVTLTLTTNDPAGPCPAVTDQMVITVNPLPTVNAGPDVAICPLASTTLTATGASTYTWSPTTGLSGTTTASVTATPAATTTYTVSGTSAAGCINTDQVVVTINPLPTVNAGVDQTVCAGASVTLSGSGAATYTWSPVITNGVAFVPSATATYTVTGTSAAGCINTDQVLVTVNPLPVVIANDAGVCAGGTIPLTASGASTYTWSPATYLNATTGATVNCTPTATITYTVTGTSAAGCISTDPITVTVSGNAAINAGPDVAICIGASTTLSASGGVTYTWNNGLGAGNNFSVSPVATTTYTVVGTDAGGCTGTDAITVTVNPLPIVNAGLDQTVCAGASVTLSGSGAATYSWNNGVTNGVAFVPAATMTYTVTGTSAAGCINTDQVLITVNPLPIVNAGTDQTICIGASVTLSGAGAATYTWNNGVTNGVAFAPATTTTYTVTGTSAAGCINTDQVVVTVNPLPIVNAGIDQTVCVGTAVTLSGSGATTYTWNNGVSNGVAFTPAATNTYTVTGTDANGCINTDQVVVTINPLPTVNAGLDQTICIGANVTLSGSGAATYSWDNSVTNTVAFAPTATTTYTVTGTSAAGCINTDQVVVTVNPLPIVNAGTDQTICIGASVTLSGAGAATYTWNNGVTNGVAFAPATTTTYTVTGTSAAGCINTDQIVVTVNPLPIVNAGTDQTVCAGTAVTLSGSGAATYTWNNGVTNGVAFTPAATNTYTVTGTDANGCINTDQVVVTINPLPTVNAGLDQTICIGANVTLSGSGAATYSWDNGVTNTVAFAPTATTTYTVTGTSAVGCINTDQVVVTVNPLPTVNAGTDFSVCTGTPVTLSGSGAATYTWSGGVTNGVAFTPAATATYTVTGTSAAGCINTDAITVTVLSTAPINAGPDVALCAGASTTLTATGGATYSWDNSLGTGNNFSVTPAATTTYTVVGTDAAGCIGTDAITVTVNPLPIVNAGLDQTVCAGTTVTLTATGAATYSWTGGITNGVGFIPTATTTYTVTGTTAAGCTATDQVVVTVNPLPIVNAGTDQTVCAGTAVTLNGTGAATYTWTGGVTNGVAFTPAATATYTVTGTTAAGCTATDQVVVTVNPMPTTNAGADQTVCAGTSVTLTASGATTYTWDNGVTNGVAFTPAVGTITYTVSGTTAAGCILTDQVIVTVNPNPVPVINGPTQYCVGFPATLSTSTPFTTYTWSTGSTASTTSATIANNPISVIVTNGFGCSATSPNFTVSENAVITANFTNTICQGQSSLIHGVNQTAAGVYSATFTSATGCDSISNVTLVVNPLPAVNAGADQAVCTTVATTLNATGATTYTWNNGVTNGIPFTQAIGSVTYTVTGTSAAGCINTDQVIVTVNPLPVVNAGPDQAICIGASATVAGSGAVTYTWNNGVINNTAFSPTLTNTYTVTGTDVNGCINTDQMVVTVNPLPAVNAGPDQVTCIGGTVSLSGSGATSYTWNNGVVNGVAFAPAATTTYTITGTDANGCINTDQVVVTVNTLPTVNAGPDQTVCIGTAVTLTGTGASSYSWNNGVTNGVAFPPAVGTLTYTVTGTSGPGCIATDQVSVTVNALPIVNAGIDQAICIGASATVAGSGAVTYTWNNGVINNTAFSPTLTNTYTVTGTDVNGCINTDQMVVTVNPLPAVNAGLDLVTCIGGTVTLSGSGATSYAWNNGVVNGVAFAPAATTTYTVTGTDANGCINTDQVVVTVNTLPTVNAGPDQTVCIGTAVTLTGTGASTYSWNNGVTNGVAFTPAVGTLTYTVTGTSGPGCIATDQVNVTVNALPIVNAGIDQAICIGASATVAGSGAVTYTWNNGVTNNTAFSPALTNTYTVTGTDVNGCINTDQVVVTVNPLPAVNAGTDQVICIGASLTLSGSGASNYTWNNGVVNGVAFAPAATTTYTVTGTDANGCINTDQVLVTVNPLPTVNAGPDQTVCVGTSVTLSGVGASTYSWNNGVTNGVAFTPVVGTITYTVTGTSGASCIATDQVNVTVNALPIVNAGIDQAVCAGTAVTLNGSGASTYTWNNSVTNATAFTPVLTNTYTVTGTDANGCINTDQVVVTVNPIPTVGAGADVTICIGETVTLSGSGAATYTWDNGVTNGTAFSPTTTTTYTVTGTTAAGCTSTDQVLVTVNPLPVVNAGLDQTVCIGTAVTLSGSGAATYSWNNGVANGVAFTPSVGTVTYTVTGTSAVGCINTDQVVVSVNPLPSINSGADQAVCAGEQVTLSATGGVNYVWNNGVTDGLAFTPAATATYTVTGTDVNGCVNTDQVVVTVNPIPTVFAGTDLSICDGQTATLTGSGANIYTWSSGVSNGVAFIPAVGTSTYTVTGTTTAGCINTDQIDVTVNALPNPSFIPDVNSGCIPLTVNIENTTANASNCVWTISDGSVYTGCGTISNTFDQAGCYDITLTTTDMNGCVNSFTAANVVCVEAPPNAAFTPSSNNMSTLHTEVIFTNNTTGAVQYAWNFGDDSAMTDEEHPLHEYPEEPGVYEVILIASSPLGCVDTATSTITIYEELLYYVPNTFTPDNDNYNQTFQPVFTSGFDPYDYTMLIFDRWGEIIFESHDAKVGWDGSYGSKGETEMVQDGTYTWKIEFKVTRNDERKMIVGHVNIIR